MPPMAQAPGTRTGADQAPAGGRRRRRLEFAGLVIGIVAGLGIALGWLTVARPGPPAPIIRPPVRVRGTSTGPDPAALDAEWVAYSDRSGCADWAGGDGVSAIRLNSSQLAWFFSDTYLGPAGPTIGFSHLSGFVHNAVVVQTATGRGSTFVTLTGGDACTGPHRPGNALPVVGKGAAWPAPSDRYWEEDGLAAGGTVVKFYDHYLAGGVPFVPVGTVMAAFQVSRLSAAGRGQRYGAVIRPEVIPLPPYTPPGGGSPILWGAALLRLGNTVYVYGTQSPDVPVPEGRLYLARVPASRLTEFSAWRFYAGSGTWAARQRNARPVQPPGMSLEVSSGFSVVRVGRRYWLIQADPLTGASDIDAYPASVPWGPFDPGAQRVLYRDPTIGLDAAHDYRIMYEARAEPALSTRGTLVISYNVNSEAVTVGCLSMAHFTNTVTMPEFVAVPLAAFAGDAAPRVTARSGAPDYPRIVQRDPSQWSDAWTYPSGCPPVPGLRPVKARPGAGKVTLSWPDAGLGVSYRIYLHGPGEAGDAPVVTASADRAAITGLRPGRYRATVVPVNAKNRTGRAAAVTFTIQ
jgi:hypothetical protein